MKFPTISSLALAALMLAVPAYADIYVVTSARSSVKSASIKDIQALYMGRKRNLAGADGAHAIDLPRDSVLRQHFYSTLTGMTPAQVSSYWARLMFTGQTMPPISFATEQTVLDYLQRNPDAVGYVGAEPTDSRVKVLLVLKTDGGTASSGHAD